ncbi:MAG: GLPGLI family protein [Chitinophagaceae bacterium]|nr:GLPGLI family protein [Chitinophagaceae bacterium]HMN32986.1 GLPGLI family protein [Chitinophagaceae bacterium]
MTKTIQLFILILLTSSIANAQNAASKPPINLKGKITFERKLNNHKMMDDMMQARNNMNNQWADNAKKNTPKYKTDIFELLFNEKNTLYKPAKNGITENKSMWGGIPAEKNVVFSDFTHHLSISQKNIFEKSYLIKDSLRNYQWKIKEEFRTIAGFNCRRAETIIMDSIFVIAFYTDAIITNGGPEGFNGLPGMILGIVMPRLNITYFATNVENYLANEDEVIAPTKGDKNNYATLETDLSSSLKQWGNIAQRMLWYVNI